jgi:hypothetical protein
MLGIAQNPSTRIVSRGLFCLRAVILALLGALVLAGTAHASDPAPAADATAAAEKAPEAAPPAPVVEKAPEAAPPAPVVEKAPEVVPPAPVVERASEAAPSAPVAEEAANGSLLPLPAATQGATTPVTAAGEAAQEVPSALTDSPTGASTAAVPRVEVTVTFVAGVASVGAPAVIIAAWAIGEFGESRRELPALGACMTDNCTAGWPGAQRFLSTSPVGFATAAAPLAAAATARAPTGGGHGGSAVASPPVSPAPGPAPSGVSGSAMGASGTALSTFLTLSGLLLFGPPRAMRRLRLSCQPWLTACFVLIPERPG